MGKVFLGRSKNITSRRLKSIFGGWPKKSKFQKRPLNVSQKFKKDPWTAYRPAQPSFFDIGTPRGVSARKKFLGGGKDP